MRVGPALGLELNALAFLEERLGLLKAQRFGLLHGDSHRPQLAQFLLGPLDPL